MVKERIYEREYFKGRKISSYKNYEDIKKKYFPRVLRCADLRKGSRVLDIGCAFGYFLKLCDGMGCETYGIDISEYAINKAKKETKAKLYVHDVNRGLHIFSNNFFDLVVMFDVIEHLYSPYSILKEAHRILKPKGKLIITTPNLNAIERVLKKILRKEKQWHGFYDSTHLYLFTPKSIEFLTEKAGFKVLELKTPFHPLPIFVSRILEKSNLGGQIWSVCQK